MTQIYNTISDPMYQRQLINWYENEEIDQWLLYSGDGWSAYYNSKNQTYTNKDILSNDDFLDFSKKSLTSMKWGAGKRYKRTNRTF